MWQEDIDQDPFMWSGGTRARTAVEYMNAVDVVRMEMPAMTFPFLCFHSRQDTMTDPEGSDHLYKCGTTFCSPISLGLRASRRSGGWNRSRRHNVGGARIRSCVCEMLRRAILACLARRPHGWSV